jgi:hypothetical protein
VKQAFTSITLVAALMDTGICHYSFVRGSHNSNSWGVFMDELSERLTRDDPNWRRNTIWLVDNHKMHHHKTVLDVIQKKKIPIFFSAPASFEILGVEMWFSHVKRKFHPLLENMTQNSMKVERRRRKGEMLELRVAAIEKAIRYVSEETGKRCFLQ